MSAQKLAKKAKTSKATAKEAKPRKDTNPKKAHVAAWKKKEVKEVTTLLKEYPIVGIASLSSLPAAQLGEIRKKMIQDAKIYTTKKTLALVAMKEAGRPELEPLLDKVNGPFSLILSKNNPFKVYALSEKSKSKTKAKAGQIAEDDILIKAGDTPFPPGPVLSDFKAAGLDVAPIEGKIKIRKDSIVTKKGQAISDKVANVLSKLDMKPMDVGLNIRGMWELGTLYTPEVLHIDSSETMNKFMTAFRNAMNLSLNAWYPTSDNASMLVTLGHMKAFNLAFNAGILTEETTPLLLAKASAQANALKGLVQ